MFYAIFATQSWQWWAGPNLSRASARASGSPGPGLWRNAAKRRGPNKTRSTAGFINNTAGCCAPPDAEWNRTAGKSIAKNRTTEAVGQPETLVETGILTRRDDYRRWRKSGRGTLPFRLCLFQRETRLPQLCRKLFALARRFCILLFQLGGRRKAHLGIIFAKVRFGLNAANAVFLQIGIGYLPGLSHRRRRQNKRSA